MFTYNAVEVAKLIVEVVVEHPINNIMLSHCCAELYSVTNYVTQSFSVIIQKIVYLRHFPFQAIITDSSGDKCRKNHHNNFIRFF